MPAKSTSNTNIWIVAVIFGLAFVGLIVGALSWWSDQGPWVAPPAAKGLMNPVPMSAVSLEAGRAAYADRCARCHGDQGNGDGPDASMYKTPPGVLSDAHGMGQQTDGEIFWKIGEGRRPMPGFAKELTEEQRWQLVDFIRSLAKAASANPAEPVLSGER